MTPNNYDRPITRHAQLNYCSSVSTTYDMVTHWMSAQERNMQGPMIRYDTIAEIDMDSNAKYTA